MAGGERLAFVQIYDHAEMLLSKRATPASCAQAIEFFFSAMESTDKLSMRLCCDTLRARADVVRLRLQYEWWLRGTYFTGPFSGDVVRVPDMIAGEIAYYAGPEGNALARECWVQPGIESERLIDLVVNLDGYEEARVRAALQIMEMKFLMSAHANRSYVTGRNPFLRSTRADHETSALVQRGGSFYWSRYFGWTA